MRDEIVLAFKTQVLDLGGWRPIPFHMDLNNVEENVARGLECQFTMEEVCGALSEMNVAKAPRLDG